MSKMLEITPMMESLIQIIKEGEAEREKSGLSDQWYDARCGLYEEIGEMVYLKLKNVPF
ncbi:MAG: hypothetical protein Q7L07_01720 [Pseudohongiella sp.]|nr:hypothetical protein [Pseudohongiella sp.]MDP1756516.1 hypothetical protein [Pseudohongiella sp.]